MTQQAEKDKSDLICKIFKLSNGDSIICMVTKETPSYIEIEDPFRVSHVYTQQGTVSIAMYRWDNTIDYDIPVRIYKNSIVAVGDPEKQIYLNYTGMITPIDEEQSKEELNELMGKILQNFKPNKLH